MKDYIDLGASERGEPVYFYLVFESLTTFKADKGNNEPFEVEREFKNKDLPKAKKEAETYYKLRLDGIEEHGTYFLPFAAYKDFNLGENAAYSIVLYLVEYYTDEDCTLLALMGEDEDETSENKELEEAIWREKGFLN